MSDWTRSPKSLRETIERQDKERRECCGWDEWEEPTCDLCRVRIDYTAVCKTLLEILSTNQ